MIPPDGHSRLDSVASQLRDKAGDDSASDDRAFWRVRIAARVAQFTNYAFALVYGLLVIRLVLALISAQPGNGFSRFVAAVTNPFVAPFQGVVSNPSAADGTMRVVPIMIAAVGYAALHAAIHALLGMVGKRKTDL